MSGDREVTKTGDDQSDVTNGVAEAHSAKAVLICVLIPTCWFGMMAVHEAGHVLGAWATGGTVTQVVLHPLAISRTDVEPNPNPLLVAWFGPIVGTVLPVALWSVLHALRSPATFFVRFFTGFCAVANGLYLGIGSFDRIGDAGDLLRSGASLWHLWMFGAFSTLAGFWMWHGQAKAFGFGPDASGVSWRQVGLITALLMASVVAALALN